MNESILIIGNGPSTKALADFGFHNLPDSIDTFAMGAAYRYFERINWWPDYYAWCDVKVAHSHRDSFKRLIEDPKVSTRQFFFPLPVSDSPRLEIVPHSSTGDFCFEKAVSLGYKTIYLIGIEGSYVESIDGSRPMTDAEFDALKMRDVFDVYASTYKDRGQAESNFRTNLRIIDKDITDNPNYFFPDYQRKGDVFSAPRSHTHRNNWKKRAERCKECNINVLNLSKNSKLDDFLKADFKNVILELIQKIAEPKEKAVIVVREEAPLVSIIIPVYNVESYISDCLESVKSQTYKNFECIIVNDGSTDASGIIARKITKDWTNIKFIDQQNIGLGGARNTGIQHASGDFIVFLDSDDMITDDHIASFIEVVSREPSVDIVTGGCQFVNENGHNIQKELNVFKSYRTLTGVELSEAEQLLGIYASSIACARLYRAELLRSNNIFFPNHLPHEDWFFTYKAFYKARLTASAPSKTYLYRIRESSLSNSISEKYTVTVQNLIDDTFKFINENDCGPLDWELFARRIVIAINSLFSRLRQSDHETRLKFGNVFTENYAIIISSYEKLNNGPLRKHWSPSQFIDFIDGEILYVQKNKTSHKNVALAAPEFYFAPPHERISKFKNKFSGKRCFIIGNGPSLNRHDLRLIEDEYTFAVNSFFYKSDESGFIPTFYMVEDSKVVEERSKEINECKYPYKIFPSIFQDKYIKDAVNVAYINMDQGFYKTGGPFYCVPRFSEDAAESVIAGQTVTYANMQLAYYMGFTEVYLIGMDFHYVIPAEHKISGNHILSTTDDPNHFHKDYFGVGKTWKDPKLDRVAMNYRQAKLAYEAVGRKIYNATIGGKLEIFDRVDYDALLRDPATGSKRQERVPPVITRHGEGSGSYSAAAADSAEVRMIAAPPPPPTPAPPPAPAPANLTPPQPPLKRPWYAPIGDAVRTHAPALFPALRAARRAVWRLAKASPVWIAAAGGLAAMGFLVFGPGPVSGRLVLAAGGLGGALVLALVALSWRLRRAIQTLSAQNRQLDEKIAYIHELAAGREERVDRLLDDHERLAGARRADHARIIAALRAELKEAEARLKAADSQTAASLRREITSMKGAVEESRASADGSEAALRAELAGLGEALRAEQAALEAALDQKIRARTNSTSASFGRAAQAAKRREAQLQEQIGALHGELERIAHETAATRKAVTTGDEALREELSSLEARLASASGARADALREKIDGLQQALKTAEAAAAAAQSAAAEGDEALREELRAVRQGLEQRLRAEVDEVSAEAMKSIAERLAAAEARSGEADAAIKAEIAALNDMLETAVKTPLKEVQGASLEALDIARTARTNAAKASRSGNYLRERVAAAERQIGAIKYPDAPDVFVFFGHHKCGSRFFRREVFGRIAESTGARIRQYKIENAPHHYSRLDDLDLPNIDFGGLGENGRDVVLFANATQRSLDKIRRTAGGDWRALRIIRDPRQVLISNYFHHKGGHPFEANGWVWDQLKKDKPILIDLPEEEGILHELDNISKHVIEDLVLAPFDDERVLTLRLEDFSADPEAHLAQIAAFMKVPDVAGLDFGNTAANPESGPWRNHFTSEIRERFKQRYGQALIDLGYEEDMDW